MAKLTKLHVIAGVALIIGGIIGYVAYRTRPVPTPRRRWRRFHEPDTIPLDDTTCQQLQGIYTIKDGTDFFGRTAVLKCSYTGEGDERVYRLSIFCEKQGIYLIAEARKQRQEILLDGHWRKAAANGTGIVRLVAKSVKKATDAHIGKGSFTIQGYFGSGDKKPDKPVTFEFERTLPQKPPLQIIAHRGGARNVDFLPMSENTSEMMKMAAELGATGVEIDVRMTRDGVPVIFHDSFLSIHTVKGKIYGGLIHNYDWKDLKTVVLRKGGFIPTLQECLHTILYETPLETIWLDIKKECDLRKIHKLQKQYMERAAMIGRTLMIYIGVPDKKILQCFIELEDYKNIPSLTELGLDVAKNINADVWAPQYTNGTAKEQIKEVHEEGRKAFVWSLDSRFMIDLFLGQEGFDGVVTNTPSVVNHWYYTLDDQAKTPATQEEQKSTST